MRRLLAAACAAVALAAASQGGAQGGASTAPGPHVGSEHKSEPEEPEEPAPLGEEAGSRGGSHQRARQLRKSPRPAHHGPFQKCDVGYGIDGASSSASSAAVAAADEWLSDDQVVSLSGVARSSNGFPEVKQKLLGAADEKERARVRALLGKIGNVGARRPLNASILRDRENLPIALSRANVAGPTVEIGVRGGDFSFYLTSKGHALSMFHAVDPWAHQEAAVYRDPANNDQAVQETYCEKAMHNIKEGFRARGAAPSFHVWRRFSDKVASEFHNGSLALVYIDGNHDFEPVLHDLELYWPKIGAGGVVAGHDYSDGWDRGVPRAVEAFLARRPGLKLHLTEMVSKAERGSGTGRNDPVVFDQDRGYFVPAPYRGSPGGVRFCCPSFWIQKPL